MGEHHIQPDSESHTPSFTRLEHAGGSAWIVQKPIPEIEAHIIEDRQKLQQDLLEIPQNAEGLDLPRTANYIRNLGLTPRPALVIDRATVPTLEAILAQHGFPAINWGQLAGRFMPALGITIIIRNPKHEAVMGPIYTEVVAVHEGIHGSSQYDHIAYQVGESGVSRTSTRVGLSAYNLHLPEQTSGQMVGKEEGTGSFLEEGLAAKLAADYLVLETGNTNGFLPASVPDEPALRQPSLANKYLVIQEDGSYGYNAHNLAGQGLELLTNREPQLQTAMLAARSNPTALRTVVTLINGIEDGLYKKLRHLPYTAAGFSTGLSRISHLA
jgi:hypothetical protein